MLYLYSAEVTPIDRPISRSHDLYIMCAFATRDSETNQIYSSLVIAWDVRVAVRMYREPHNITCKILRNFCCVLVVTWPYPIYVRVLEDFFHNKFCFFNQELLSGA
jgi:hypothetical protein